MTFHILTIFPEMFKGFLNESILKKAQGKGVIKIKLHDIRKYSKNKHKKVDDTPYGGGAGMVFMPQPLFDCIEAVKKEALRRSPQDSTVRRLRGVTDSLGESFGSKVPVIYMTPKGQKLTQSRVEKLSTKFTQLILLCGHYEGIDQRVIDKLVDMELSIGDYVLSGGELAAMVVVDAVSRLVPGAIGKEASHEEETFSKKLGRKKEYPHYTKPDVFKGMKVPDVLLSGHHAEIEKWRKNHLR